MTPSLRLLIVLSVLPCCLGEDRESTPPSRFSEVQTLDPDLAALGPSILGIDWAAVDWLPAPPDNRIEAEALLQLQQGLDDHRRKRIQEQATMTWRYWGIDAEEKPATARLAQAMTHEMIRAVVAQKVRFDRIRPSFVETNIVLVIPNPDHPAYPSGHACQAHSLAMIFAALDTRNAAAHLALAEEVTLNREYAGVHYRSDSIAGRHLARYALLRSLSAPMFLGMWHQAAEEWKTEERSVERMTRNLVRLANERK